MTVPNGEQGQEPAADAPAGQAPGSNAQGQEPATPDLSAITDPHLRAWVESRDKAARENGQEAAKYRVANRTLTEAQAELQRRTETDTQRAERERAEAETQRQQEREETERVRKENRELKVGQALRDTLAGSAHNPAKVARDITRGDYGEPKFDSDGNLTNGQELIEKVRQEDPHLFRRTSGDAGAGADGGASPVGSMNDNIRNALAARRGRG